MTKARDVIADEVAGYLSAADRAYKEHEECADKILTALLSAPEPVRLELAALLSPWRPKWRHKKRGSDYEEVGEALLQNSYNLHLPDNAILMIYRSQDGHLYARPIDEFNDGRFDALPAPPSEDK